MESICRYTPFRSPKKYGTIVQGNLKGTLVFEELPLDEAAIRAQVLRSPGESAPDFSQRGFCRTKLAERLEAGVLGLGSEFWI